MEVFLEKKKTKKFKESIYGTPFSGNTMLKTWKLKKRNGEHF